MESRWDQLVISVCINTVHTCSCIMYLLTNFNNEEQFPQCWGLVVNTVPLENVP